MSKPGFIGGPGGIDTEEQQLMLLRQQYDLLKNSLPVHGYKTGQTEVVQPQVHIDVPNAADQLAPQFDELIGTQQDGARAVRGLGMQGQLALENSSIQTGLLDRLGSQQQKAISQRNAALRQLTLSSDRLGMVNMGLGTANRSLAGINRGVAGVNFSIAHLENALCGALGNLGTGIADIGEELITTRLEIVDALSNLEDVFMWSHREQMWIMKEQMWVQQQILKAVQNPFSTQARNAWQIGERCRAAGDLNGARRMFAKSLDIDPSESRNYFSLGLIHLNFGDVRGALDYFNTASQYAAGDPSMMAYARMHLAKVEFFERNYKAAKGLLDSANTLDVTNLEVWFDLALCCLKLNDKKKALYYIKNLLYANPRYGLKIIGNPEFASVMPGIRDILKMKR